MTIDEPSLGETIQIAGRRTAKFAGSGWRMTLWAWAEPSVFVLEVEWIDDVGQFSAFSVPSALVSEAQDMVLAISRPGFRSGPPLTSRGDVRLEASQPLEQAQVRSVQAAWRFAGAVQEPEEQWSGRDGRWAETELWEDGCLRGRLGARLPIGESTELDAAILRLLLCVPLDALETDLATALAKWRTWCAPRPTPSLNRTNRRRR